IALAGVQFLLEEVGIHVDLLFGLGGLSLGGYLFSGSVIGLAFFLFLTLHVRGFRRAVLKTSRTVGRGIHWTVVDGPAWVLRQPLVRTVLDSRPVVLLRRYLLRPTLLAAALA